MKAKKIFKLYDFAPSWVKAAVGSLVLLVFSVTMSFVFFIQVIDLDDALGKVVHAYTDNYIREVSNQADKIVDSNNEVLVRTNVLSKLLKRIDLVNSRLNDHERRIAELEKKQVDIDAIVGHFPVDIE